MTRWICGLAAALFSLAAAGSPVADETILAARDAFARGDRARLDKLLPLARGHVLEQYVEYWRLRNRIEEASPSEIEAFFARHEGSVLADRLRVDWLKQLGKSRQWPEFERQLPVAVQTDGELACYALQARHARQDQTALEEAAQLWMTAVELAGSCSPLMDTLVIEGRLRRDDVWLRLRRQAEAKRVAGARAAAAYLPDREAPDSRALDSAIGTPAAFLNRQRANFAASRTGRELAMISLARLARDDPHAAAARFESLKSRFSAAERAYVYGQLGWQGALRHAPEALAWYKAADRTPMSDEQIAWKARAALRAGDWRVVHATIEAMPASLASDPAWIYWLGRAHDVLGRHEEARQTWARIAGQPNFYGNLADEDLGRPIAVPPRAAPPTEAELAQVGATPDVQRALALFRLEMRIEGVREWNWSLRGRDDRFLLAAAEIAQREQLFDRAISAADRTRDEHDFHVRYLAPFREHVEPKARALDLDSAWVYGLMRQESRFVTGAKSSAGARGLMQLMPSTAQWVANKIGLKEYSLSRVNDMNVNVALGTSYLKMVLQQLDHHPVLASAAYNAGPGRARRWRDTKPLEAAVYIETIPLSETRDYVKKVLSNAVYYDNVLNGRSGSLKSRMGVVNPRGTGEAGAGELP